MLKIFKYPECFSKGLEDRFNIQVERHLNRQGLPCVIKTLWPDLLARHLFFANSSLLYHLFHDLLAPLYCWMDLLSIQAEDVVWVTGSSIPITDTDCWFEKKVIQRGASYIFWMEDDWFSDPKMKASAEARVPLAHLVVAVTPALCDRIAGLYPGKPILFLEEPIDIERLSLKERPGDGPKPLVIWNGRPWNIKALLMLDHILLRVYRDIPFNLRVTTGMEKPPLQLSIPWEWVPYDRRREADDAAGAVAGLAPLEDTVFNSCKGNYKVKTYMALGIPPLASAIGYNFDLIRHGETGFLLNTEAEWEAALRFVVQEPALARRIGDAARRNTIHRFSYESLMPIWARALKLSFPGKLGTQSTADLPTSSLGEAARAKSLKSAGTVRNG